VIVDGFPRTVAQAEAFDALLAAKGLAAKALVFDVDQAVLMERLTGRWTNPRTGRVYHTIFNPPKTPGIDDDDGGELIQRPDDRAETIEKRLREYDEKTAPLIDYYGRAGKAVHVDALADIDVVTGEIVRALPGLSGNGETA
jgi:adenylate kinase